MQQWERLKGELQTYSRRRPELSPLHRIVSAGLEKLQSSWESLFQHKYGALRFEVIEAFQKFLNCGILRHGCAKAECTNPQCGHTELIPFSCKRRCLCSSCNAKRAVLFAEKLNYEILLNLPHNHVVFSLPKRIRLFFKFDRSNLDILYHAAWTAWKECLEELCPTGRTGAVMELHPAGDLLQWHPHLHGIHLAGLLLPDGTFMPLQPEQETLCRRFRQHVLTALVKKELLTQDAVDNMNSWPHSGFNVHIHPSPALWAVLRRTSR